MTRFSFMSLGLVFNDYIWIMTESGEGFFGYYRHEYNESRQTFKFHNNSNGQLETIFIESLQRLERAK